MFSSFAHSLRRLRTRYTRVQLLRAGPYLLFGLIVPFATVWAILLPSSGPTTWTLAVWLPIWAIAVGWRVILPIEIPRAPRPAALGGSSNFETYIRALNDARELLEASDLDRRALDSFILLCLDPEAYRKRVTEHIQLERVWTKRRVDVDFFVPPNRDGKTSALLIPVTQPRKGRRLYDFHLHSSDDTAVLNSRDSLVIVCAAFRRLMNELQPWVTSSLDTTAFEAAYLAGLRRITFDIRADPDGRKLQLEKRMQDEAFSNLENCLWPRGAPTSAFEHARDRALQFLDLHARHTSLIVRRNAPAGYCSLGYSYVSYTPALVRLRSSNPGGALAGFRRSYKKLSGSVEIKIERARRCASYHLEITSPPGSYLGKLSLVDDDGREIQPHNPTDYNTNLWKYRNSRDTDDYAHFYGKDLHRLDSGLRISIPIRERLWGSTLAFFVSSLFVGLFAVLIAAAGKNAAESGPSSVDVAALSLSLPAFLIGIFSALSTLYKRSLHSSVLGVVGTLISAVVFVVLIGGYASQLVTSSDQHAYQGFYNLQIGLAVLLIGCATTALIARAIRFVQVRRQLV